MDGLLVLWVMCIVLTLALVALVFLLKGVLSAARSITPTIAGVASAASKDLDAVIALVTTQNYISQTVAGLANYGGSLDVALPDA
jgi:hypothetical protein